MAPKPKDLLDTALGLGKSAVAAGTGVARRLLGHDDSATTVTAAPAQPAAAPPRPGEPRGFHSSTAPTRAKPKAKPAAKPKPKAKAPAKSSPASKAAKTTAAATTAPAT